MHAPEWVCRKLGDFHSHLRLAWNGADECFALVQLYHNRDASLTYREFWEERGPVFSKKGRPCFRDWDPMSYTPIWVTNVTIWDVFNGKVLKDAKRWALIPIASRVYKEAKRRSQEIEDQVEDSTGAAAEELYYKGQKGEMGNHAPIVAKKFITEGRNQRRFRNGELDFSECKVPPPPPGGYEKHLEKDLGDPDDLGDICSSPK